MTKMGILYREEIKTLILICRARGFNPRQTLAYVNEHLEKYNKQVSESYIKGTIEDIRQDANLWLKNLGHGKSDYVAVFKDVIDRLNTEQNELWAMIDKNKDKGGNKDYMIIKAYAEIHSINKTLWELYKDLPLLTQNAANKTIDNIVFEDTTSVYPEIST